MTICIGLIPNDKTVMLIQDAEISYEGIGLTQDIVSKVKVVSDDVIVGVVGIPHYANEVIEHISGRQYKHAKDLRDFVEEAYQAVREEKLAKNVLRKYGFRNIREVTNPSKETNVDPAVRDEILKTVNEYPLSLVLATTLDRPQLYLINPPGRGYLEDNTKMYVVSGSGSVMAIDKMGEELEQYRWLQELSIDEGVTVLLRAGKASEKHIGVGGPFDITYITRSETGESKVVKPDQKKINMVMYLFPLGVQEKVMMEVIARMRDEKISAEQLAEYIKANTKVGIEFDKYFRL